MEVELNTSKSELRKFGFILATGLMLIFGLFFPWLLERPWPQWPFIAAGVLIACALVAPIVLKPVYLAWMKIGAMLGWLNTRIILGIVFFLLFMPIAMMFRLFGRDSMRRKLDPEATTYRIKADTMPANNLEKPF